MYLLDTNVVSELRKAGTGKANAAVVRWAAGVAALQLFISVVTVLELERGILLIERRDSRQGGSLRRWLESQVLPSFDGRILPIDLAVARACAALHVPDPRAERDALIAATAHVHRLTVATRNTMDFEPLGVELCDPWRHGIK